MKTGCVIILLLAAIFGVQATLDGPVYTVNVTVGDLAVLDSHIKLATHYVYDVTWHKMVDFYTKKIFLYEAKKLFGGREIVQGLYKERMYGINHTAMCIKNVTFEDGGLYLTQIRHRRIKEVAYFQLNVFGITTTESELSTFYSTTAGYIYTDANYTGYMHNITDYKVIQPSQPSATLGVIIGAFISTAVVVLVVVMVIRRRHRRRHIGDILSDIELKGTTKDVSSPLLPEPEPEPDIQGDTPSRPPLLTVSVTSETSATLTWKKPRHSGKSRLTGYIVKILEVTDTGSEQVHESKLSATRTKYMAKNLDLERSYIFQVAARNPSGSGTFATCKLYNTLDEIKESYRTMFSTISLDPANPNITVPTDTFYLDLELLNVDDKIHSIEKLGSYQDAFRKDGGPQRIALYSPAGGGKSVLCEVIAYSWAKNGTLGDRYEVIIFLKLRGYSMSDDITQMVINQTLPNRRGQQNTIKELIDKYSGKILFVLDGYDELVEGSSSSSDEKVYTLEDLLNHYSQDILISTRPSQLSEMKKLAKVDTKIRIQGFAELQAICFIKKYCSARKITNKADPSKPIEDVVMEQLKKKRLVSLTKNPQQLQLVCNYMRDNAEISGSLVALYDHFYEMNRKAFLKKVAGDPKADVNLKKDVHQSHHALLRSLQRLALCGFVQGRLIYDESVYLKLLEERFVTVFDKLGAVYCEEALGAQNMVLGFRHKSFQEFFAAKFLFLYIIMNQGGEYPEEVVEVLQQWKNIRKAVKYERLFVFMAGMTKDETSARKLMQYITNIIEQLPSYFESESSLDVHDSEDLPRQLVLMQVKAALEIKEVHQSINSKYIDDLLKALPYADGIHLPDVNTDQTEWKEDDTDDIVASPEKPGLQTVPDTDTITSGDGFPTRSHTEKKEKNPTLGDVNQHKKRSPMNRTRDINEVTQRAFWFRIARQNTKCDLRIDCLALPASMLQAKYPVLRENKHCFFTHDVCGGLEHVLTTYPSVELFAVDCNTQDVKQMLKKINLFQEHTTIGYFHTCQTLVVKANTKDNAVCIDCKDETRSALSLLRDVEEEMWRTFCLQQFDCGALEDNDAFITFITELGKEIGDGRRRVEQRGKIPTEQPVKLQLEKGSRRPMAETVSRLQQGDVSVEEADDCSNVVAVDWNGMY